MIPPSTNETTTVKYRDCFILVVTTVYLYHLCVWKTKLNACTCDGWHTTIYYGWWVWRTKSFVKLLLTKRKDSIANVNRKKFGAPSTQEYIFYEYWHFDNTNNSISAFVDKHTQKHWSIVDQLCPCTHFLQRFHNWITNLNQL